MNTVPYYLESMPSMAPRQGYSPPNTDYANALSTYGAFDTGGLVDAPTGMSIRNNANENWHGGRLNGFLPSQTVDPNTGAVTNNMGWGMPALSVAQGAFNAWMGMKQYGLAKAQLAESKQQFNLNYDAQRTTTNAQLRDRQMARVASNPGAYQSVGDYMQLNGIGGR